MRFIQRSGRTLLSDPIASNPNPSPRIINLDFRGSSANIPTAITIDHRVDSTSESKVRSPRIYVRLASGIACACAYLATPMGLQECASRPIRTTRGRVDPSGHSLFSQSGQMVFDLPAHPTTGTNAYQHGSTWSGPERKAENITWRAFVIMVHVQHNPGIHRTGIVIRIIGVELGNPEFV